MSIISEEEKTYILNLLSTFNLKHLSQYNFMKKLQALDDNFILASGVSKVAIIPKDNYYVLNQRVALIRPKNKQQTNYLFSYINSHQRYFKLHGAGMSQNGAKCLANKGYSA